MRRKTHNSGVCIKGGEGEYDDMNDYYGVISEIIEARYLNQLRILFFKCNWHPVANQGVSKRDSYGFTCVNLNRTCYGNEPFALAHQAQRVFYMKDTKNRQLEVVIKTQPHCSYNIPEKNSEEPIATENRVLMKRIKNGIQVIQLTILNKCPNKITMKIWFGIGLMFHQKPSTMKK
ncbi:hypothetical protein MKW92_015732 [Papaver armeniacum]|nr:hypothetical protein MKW92_015732 [Papaver armeniacum]